MCVARVSILSLAPYCCTLAGGREARGYNQWKKEKIKKEKQIQEKQDHLDYQLLAE